MPPDSPAPALADLRDVAPVYDRLLDLADDQLDRPISVTLDAWEDGTYRLKVYHQRRATERELLRYHSAEGTIEYGVEADGALKKSDVLTTIFTDTV